MPICLRRRVKLRWRLDFGRQRLGTLRQRRIVETHVDAPPVHRRLFADRCVEIVSQGGAECHFIAWRHAQLIDDRRQAILAGRFEQLGERFDFGRELSQL